MKKVLVYLHHLTLGGIEIMLLKSLPHLTHRGITVDICCTGPPAELDDQFRSFGCKIYRIRRSFNLYYTASRICAFVLAENYDLVHSHYGHASGGAALGAKRASVKAIVSFHTTRPEGGTDFDHLPLFRTAKTAWLKIHRHHMTQGVAVFIGHSEANLDSYCRSWRKSPQLYRIVRNGIDFGSTDMNKLELRRKLGLPVPKLLLLHVGRFKKAKNHRGLLQILSEVSKKRADVHLVMVGDGELRMPIARLAERMGLSSLVSFAGNQRNPWDYYFASDVFVFPSFWEGFGNVLVESQGVGLPVVASDIPGHREAVAPAQRRFLFPLPDYRRAAELVLDQARAERDGMNTWVVESESFVKERFNIAQMVDRLAEIYEEVIDGASLPKRSLTSPNGV